MSRSLHAALIEAKNLLSDPGAWLILMEIDAPVLSEPLRLVRNNENINWNGQTWNAFNFGLGDTKETTDGSINGITAWVSNINRIVQGHIEEADGGAGAIITLRVVYSDRLDIAAAFEEIFEVGDVDCGSQRVSFEFLPPTILRRIWPWRTFDRDTCGWQFKDSATCGYSGAGTCDLTLATCISLGNETRYVGCPGIPGTGLDDQGPEAVYA